MATKKSFVVLKVYYKRGEYDVDSIEGEDVLRAYFYEIMIDRWINELSREEDEGDDEKTPEVDEETKNTVERFTKFAPLEDVVNAVLTIGAQRIDNQEGYGIVSVVEGVVVNPSDNSVSNVLPKKDC